MSFRRPTALISTLLFIPFAIFAQEANPPKPAAAPEATPAPASADASVKLSIPGEEVASDELKVTVNFEAEEVKVIIRSTADLFGLNVVIPEVPEMKQKMDLSLKEVTWKEIFKSVLDQVKYSYVQEDGSIIKLRSKADVEVEPMEIRTIMVDHTPAAEMAKIILPIVAATPKAQVLVDSRRGALIVITRKDKFAEVIQLISQLDVPPPQVMIESKFVEVSNRDTEALGIDWSSLGGYEVSAGPFDRNDSRNTGQTSSGTNGNTANSGSTSSTNTALGGATTGTVGSTAASSLAGALTSGFTSGNTRAETAVFNAAQFKVILNALETNRNTKLVSNPTVVALNGTAASINIGEEYPIPNYTYNQERGVFEVSDFEYKPIGILLKVTPQVNRLGFINLDIEPEVSSRSTETVNFGGAASANIPIINTRKTKSAISIKDTFTLAIGGLVERTQGKNETKVPLLGDLPLVGRLFTTKRNEDSVRNLIIFITAKTLNPDGSTYKDVFSPQQLYQMGVSEADAPGYLAPKDQQEYYDKVLQARDRLAKEQSLAKLKAEDKALESAEKANAEKLKKEKEAADKKAAAAAKKNTSAEEKSVDPISPTAPSDKPSEPVSPSSPPPSDSTAPSKPIGF